MKKTFALRMLLFLLIAVMTLSVFAGCNGGKNQVGGNTSSSEGTSTDPVSDAYDEKGFLKDDLPNLNFNETVTVLNWKPEVNEFGNEANFDKVGNVIDKAIFSRNESVETRLNITLQFTAQSGNATNKNYNLYLQRVQNASSAGDYWDIIAAYTRGAAVCTSNGLLKNLNSITGSYLNYEKPWWSTDMINSVEVADRLYFITGDISPALVQMTYCVYFNVDEMNSIQLGAENPTDPYTLVEQNQWTLENMMELSKGYYLDNNQNSSVDENDKLEIIGRYYDWPAMLHGCNVPITDRTEAGSFVMNSDYNGQKAMTIMDTLRTWIGKSGMVIDESIGDKPFINGNALFIITESGRAISRYSDVRFEYGCVPCPKYTSDQENYYSTVRQPITMFGVMYNVPEDRLKMDTAVLECMGSEGYRRTTPVIFEEVMKYNASRSEKMTEMLVLIRNTVFFDVSRIFAVEAGGIVDYPGLALRDGATWESYLNSSDMIQAKTKITELYGLLLALKT